MKNRKAVDVAIIGGGWTGLLMAKELSAATSLSVVVLERGGMRRTEDYATVMDEIDYSLRLRMMQNLAEETVTHRHSNSDRAVPIRQHGAFHPGTGIGGAGEHWGALAFRYLPDVFTLKTRLKEKFGAGRIPEASTMQDWGITYDELEPHYWYAEQLMGVSGKAGNLRGQIIEGGNVFEGPRSHEFPTPPLKTSYLMSLFEKGTKELGFHPYQTPAATLSVDYKNPDGVSRAGCAYCGYCERHGCMIGAKAQPTNVLMPVLAKRKHVEIRTGSRVRRIVHKDGRATGVQYTDAAGEEYFQPASLVILGSFTLSNTRLLYLSKIGTAYDPATGKGTLGKNLTHQVRQQTRIAFDKPLNVFMGSGPLGMRISDFDGDNGLKPEDGILRFGTMACQSQGGGPIANFGAMPRGTVKKNWGSDWKAAAIDWRDRMASVNWAGEHLAYRQNYFDLDPEYTDAYGDPLLRMTLNWTEHEYKQQEFSAKLGAKIAPTLGAKADDVRISRDPYNVIEYQSTHLQGGTIMGTSPETSVVSKNGQHWDIPNLWVVGASTFPQNASPNPTLTVIATTHYASDALIQKYLKRGKQELI